MQTHYSVCYLSWNKIADFDLRKKRVLYTIFNQRYGNTISNEK